MKHWWGRFKSQYWDSKTLPGGRVHIKMLSRRYKEQIMWLMGHRERWITVTGDFSLPVNSEGMGSLQKSCACFHDCHNPCLSHPSSTPSPRCPFNSPMGGDFIIIITQMALLQQSSFAKVVILLSHGNWAQIPVSPQFWARFTEAEWCRGCSQQPLRRAGCFSNVSVGNVHS